MEPVQTGIADIIEEHPEYQALLELETDLNKEWTPENGEQNPFLHMGMHLAIREQVSTDRPQGISAIHGLLSNRFGSPHEAEHLMMEALGEVLWRAQREGILPDDKAYLENLRKL